VVNGGRTGDFLFNGPENASSTVVLAHGAGAPMDSPFLNEFARGLGDKGIRVARFEFPYMRARRDGGRKGAPDREPALREAWREAAAGLGGGERIVVGGKSLGGRIASLVADEVCARGLLCLGYPFHPPGKPDRLRTRHLAELKTPTMILQGARDPFGTPEDVAGYALSAAIRVVWVEDGDHSWKPRVRSGRTLESNLAFGVEQAAAFVKDLELERGPQ
jgi:predicted alpha/beta-hydrolase family hydrolase